MYLNINNSSLQMISKKHLWMISLDHVQYSEFQCPKTRLYLTRALTHWPLKQHYFGEKMERKKIETELILRYLTLGYGGDARPKYQTKCGQIFWSAKMIIGSCFSTLLKLWKGSHSVSWCLSINMECWNNAKFFVCCNAF